MPFCVLIIRTHLAIHCYSNCLSLWIQSLLLDRHYRGPFDLLLGLLLTFIIGSDVSYDYLTNIWRLNYQIRYCCYYLNVS